MNPQEVKQSIQEAEQAAYLHHMAALLHYLGIYTRDQFVETSI